MSQWLNSLSTAEKTEMFLDACAAYNANAISYKEFQETLAKLGYNATDIDELEKQHAPSDEDSGEE